MQHTFFSYFCKLVTLKIDLFLTETTTSIEPVNADTTTQSADFNSEPADVSSAPKKTTNRSSTTISAFKNTTQPTTPRRLIIKTTPTENAVSKEGEFVSGIPPSKPLLATTPVSSAKKSTFSYSTVNRRIVTTSIFTLDTNKQSGSRKSVTKQAIISGFSTVRHNITGDNHSEHSNARYTTSTTSYDDNNNASEKNNYLKTITEEKTVFFTTQGYFDNDSNKTNTDSSSNENKSLGINESKTPYTDYMDPMDGLMDDTGIRETSSSPGSIELIPLIVGVVASVVVGIIVTVIMACIWVRSKRTKQDKHQEDQMNIMSEYIETNLCT